MKTQKRKPFAKKSFGQNFLVDENYVEKIIGALNPQTGETIVEIGAGRGALTRKLIETRAQIIAIEFDRDLIPILKAEFTGAENFILIEDDALKLIFGKITTGKSKVVANLPYNISTAILQKLFEQRESFSELILMLQREVVERMTAEEGTSERGYLSILVEANAIAEKLFDVPPTAFRPIPKVWSSVLSLKIKDEKMFSSPEVEKQFWQLVSAGFAQKRKTILNNLRSAPPNLREKFAANGTLEEILNHARIEPRRRAETLTLAEWKALAEIIDGFEAVL